MVGAGEATTLGTLYGTILGILHGMVTMVGVRLIGVGAGAGIQPGIIITIGTEAGMAEVIGDGTVLTTRTIIVADIADMPEGVILRLALPVKEIIRETELLQAVLRERVIIREEHPHPDVDLRFRQGVQDRLLPVHHRAEQV